MITNQEFETALKNEDNIKIMKAASRKFRRLLSVDEVYNCSLHGLFNALKVNKLGIKFTTILYSNVNWACLDYLNKNKVKDDRPASSSLDIPVDSNWTIDEYVDGLPNDLKNVLKQKYEDNMTLFEIGAANGYSYETARQRINHAIDILKKKCF